MATSSSDSDKKLQWSYSERWGFTILGIGVLILFAVIVLWIFGTKPAPESHHISVYLTPDTLSANVRDLYSRAEVDSMITILTDHEALLEKKYQYLLEQREEEDRFKTYLAIIVSIVVSIAAFFGFKTISDLKKQCRDEAATLAERKAMEIAEEKAEEKAGIKATEIAQKIAKEECGKLMKSDIEPIARETAETSAKSQTSEYLKLFLPKEIRSQLSEIQQTEVFQSLKKENEEVIQLKFEHLRTEVLDRITVAPSAQEDSENPMNPNDIDFTLPNED